VRGSVWRRVLVASLFRNAFFDEYLSSCSRYAPPEKIAAPRATVETQLVEAIESGPGKPIDANYWAHIRSEGIKLARQRKRK
jgi:hypothetical protein